MVWKDIPFKWLPQEYMHISRPETECTYYSHCCLLVTYLWTSHISVDEYGILNWYFASTNVDHSCNIVFSFYKVPSSESTAGHSCMWYSMCWKIYYCYSTCPKAKSSQCVTGGYLLFLRLPFKLISRSFPNIILLLAFNLLSWNSYTNS